MIDVVFLLLIFFMLVSEISHAEASAKLELPYAPLADDDPTKDRSHRVIVNVEKRMSIKGVGKMLIHGVPHDLKALTQVLQKNAYIAGMEDPQKKISNLRVCIRADFDARTKAIQWIFDACQKNMVYKTEISATRDPTKNIPKFLHEKKRKKRKR
jgi:biopolymer transport protein ExbD